MNIQLDDGFQFGLGLFETIDLKNGKPILLDWHLERLNSSQMHFGINQNVTSRDVYGWLSENEPQPQQALKIMVTEKNCLFAYRHNPYIEETIAKGFCLDYSSVLRNETSSFTYHKTMNYGDNILEKRKTKETGIDEVIFLNTKGQICEGSTTNIFFVKDDVIYTPKITCGLLPGIMRRYVMETAKCKEVILYPEDVKEMEECFVTNSLMGIMGVRRLGNMSFSDSRMTKHLQQKYKTKV